jgi:betaine-aldehyde dehydrogenase
MQTLQNLIGGERQEGAEDSIAQINPATEEAWGTAPNSTSAEVHAATEAARRAFGVYRDFTPAERQSALLEMRAAVSSRWDELVDAEVRDTGKSRSQVRELEAGFLQNMFGIYSAAARNLEGRATAEYVRDHTSTVRREPKGVVGIITPWNYPLLLGASHILASLAAGNTVVIKPAENTPSSTLLFAEVLQEFLPPGALNVVCGGRETGRALVRDAIPSHISFTGSSAGGRDVAAAASPMLKTTTLELGGNAPVILFADADLDLALASLPVSAFTNAGQDCTGSSRMLVEASIYDEVVTRVAAVLENLRVGPPDDDSAFYSTLISQQHLERVTGFLEDLPNSAEVVTGGQRIGDRGFYLRPALVAGVAQTDRIVQQEIFGPVLTIQPFRDEQEAIALANGVDAGLGSSLFTRDHGRVLRVSRELEYGQVWVNTHIHVMPTDMPHGGFRSSGYGKDLSFYSAADLTRVKHVTQNLNS